MGHSRCTSAKLCRVSPANVIGAVVAVACFAIGFNQHIYIEHVAA